MPEKPHLQILDREIRVAEVKESLGPRLHILKDVINYGTNLIVSCLSSSNKTLGDVITTTVFLKQIVTMLDGFEVLASSSCSHAGALQLRAVHEASLYLDWLLTSNKEEKAVHYYVHNLRIEQQWQQRFIPDHDAQSAFIDDLGNFSGILHDSAETLSQHAIGRLQELNDFLNKEPFATVNVQFEKLRKEKGYESEWYKPLGARSVRAIAKELNRLHEYMVLYARSSEHMHSSRYSHHITIGSGSINIEPIRTSKEIDGDITLALNLAFDSYRKVLSHYRPGQLSEYNRRYVSEWRDAFLKTSL